MHAQKTGSKRLYFDQRIGAKNVQHRYVAWLDGMGTTSALLKSLPIAVNFVMRIHAAVLFARDAVKTSGMVELFPMNDGVFAVSAEQNAIRQFLRASMGDLIAEFTSEPEPKHRFMVRSAVAFGPVAYGNALDGGNKKLAQKESKEHVDRIVLGMPLAQAYEAEKRAPPFGAFIHESARAVAGQELWPETTWPWWKPLKKNAKLDLKGFCGRLYEHFEWARTHPSSTGYNQQRAEAHLNMAKEYFQDFWPNDKST